MNLNDAGPTGQGKRRVAILQSNYIPWKGYFDFIAAVDEFVLFDNVQYTERDWRNRNRVKTAKGLQWLSVPVLHSRDARVQDVRIVSHEPNWARKHFETLRHSYASAPFAPLILPWLKSMYDEAAGIELLSTLNRRFIEGVCSFLDISTPLSASTDYMTLAELDACAPTQRLVELCRRAGAETYVSGPNAKAYLEMRPFEDAGIGVEWMSYEGYPEYPQLHGPFEHAVSIIDLLMMEGEDAGAYMRFAPQKGRGVPPA